MKVSGSYLIVAGFCLALLSPQLITAQPASAQSVTAQPVTAQPIRQVRLTRFALQSSAVIGTAGDSLSSVSYHSANYWFPVTVPSTVLTGLVANKVYPDPYTGMNNMLIPDASDTFNREYHLEQYSHL
ncbi:MAG TPA: hypothetical protein VN824_00740, partial [Puia sp.]|nr:hypothetical protein [Puia sp.]